MKGRKQLIGGIVFLVLQVIVWFVNGIPQNGADAYGMGYLVGSLVPGVIGIIFLAAFFISKCKAK